MVPQWLLLSFTRSLLQHICSWQGEKERALHILWCNYFSLPRLSSLDDGHRSRCLSLFPSFALSGEILARILIAIVCICIVSLAFWRTGATLPHCFGVCALRHSEGRTVSFAFLSLSWGQIGPSHYVIGLIELRQAKGAHQQKQLSLSFAISFLFHSLLLFFTMFFLQLPANSFLRPFYDCWPWWTTTMQSIKGTLPQRQRAVNYRWFYCPDYVTCVCVRCASLAFSLSIVWHQCTRILLLIFTLTSY